MAPEDVMNLVNSKMNFEQILGNQEIASERGRNTAAQNQVENYYKALNANIALGKDKRDAETDALRTAKIDRSTPFEVDGKMYVDWTDSSGGVVKREELGSNTYKPQAKEAMVSPDGKVGFYGPEDKIPQGSTKLGTSREGMTDKQKMDMDILVAGIDQMISTGKDGKGDKVEGSELAERARIFNQYHPTKQWMMVPEGPGMLGSGPKWVKLPKDEKELKAVPGSTVVSRNPKGKEVTMEQVRAKAAQHNVSINEVLKFMNSGR